MKWITLIILLQCDVLPAPDIHIDVTLTSMWHLVITSNQTNTTANMTDANIIRGTNKKNARPRDWVILLQKAVCTHTGCGNCVRSFLLTSFLNLFKHFLFYLMTHLSVEPLGQKQTSKYISLSSYLEFSLWKKASKVIMYHKKLQSTTTISTVRLLGRNNLTLLCYLLSF